MNPARHAIAAAVLVAASCAARAQDLQWHGMVDLRAVSGDGSESWLDGGLGKTRSGNGSGAAVSGALSLRWQATPALAFVADAQLQPALRQNVDLLAAYARFRPVSTTAWRWSTRAGAFFAPVSMENDAIGWTSPWTLTPSAMNTWVGEELRTIGIETSLEHRGDAVSVTGSMGVFGWNDPAGELLGARGWAMGDTTSGLRAVLREPDAYAPVAYASPPVLYKPFVEYDNRPGAYAALAVEAPAYGQARLLYYDNRADPATHGDVGGRTVFSWYTSFWSGGLQKRIGAVTWLAQAMRGSTIIEPAPGLRFDTRFATGFVMAAWDRGAWQPVVRLEAFQARQYPDEEANPFAEHGNAITLALNWRPRDHLRIVGEWVRIDSVRNQRRSAGLPARVRDQQVQFAVRWAF
jgi:hypothetical protein